jgi:hypothetical protein
MHLFRLGPKQVPSPKRAELVETSSFSLGNQGAVLESAPAQLIGGRHFMRMEILAQGHCRALIEEDLHATQRMDGTWKVALVQVRVWLSSTG